MRSQRASLCSFSLPPCRISVWTGMTSHLSPLCSLIPFASFTSSLSVLIHHQSSPALLLPHNLDSNPPTLLSTFLFFHPLRNLPPLIETFTSLSSSPASRHVLCFDSLRELSSEGRRRHRSTTSRTSTLVHALRRAWLPIRQSLHPST
jgi:hypothetical protein